MKVCIQSHLGSPSEGTVDVSTHPCATVDSLTAAFCMSKGVQYSPRFVLYNAENRPLNRTSTVASVKINDGDMLYLGRKDHDSRSKTSHWWIVASLTCILGVGGIVISSLLYAETGGRIPFDFGVVFDAGSTHTQVTVYRWAGEKDLGTGRAKQLASCTVNRSISSYDISVVGQPLVDCLNNLSSEVPPNEMFKMPLYLGATAGMRLLNLSDSLLARALLMSIRCSLTAAGYSVKSVDIISGMDEGLFAWITANYLKNILLDDRTIDHFALDGKGDLAIPPKTVGAMDLGGASTQVVYEIPFENVDSSGPDNTSVQIVRLYGHSYQLHSRSYLCFGIEEAHRRYLALLVQDPFRNETDITNPCGPKGDSVTVTADFLFNQPCTKSNQRNSQNVMDIQNKTFTFHGASDEQGCSSAVSQLFNISACSTNFTECFQPISLPYDDQFLAFSAFYYVMKDMNLTNVTLPEYKKATISLCEKSLNSVEMEVQQNENGSLCFKSKYVYYILTQGYNITESSWENIEFLKKIDENDIGWSLGYMINATNAIPSEKPTPPVIDLAAFIVIVILSALILVMSMFFFMHACQRHENPGMYEHLIEA